MLAFDAKLTHAVLPTQLLRFILRESLKLASQDKMTSIAWPTIGCGNLEYPKDVVAAAMFDAVRRFSAANQGSSLRDVRIVVFKGDQNTIDEFEKVLEMTSARANVQRSKQISPSIAHGEIM